MIESLTKKSKANIVSRIADHVNLRYQIVEEVLDGLIDIVIDDIMNEEEFYLRDMFSVSVSEWKKNYQIDKNNSKRSAVVKSHRRLMPKMSSKILKLWKIRNNEFHGEKGIITKDNWKNILEKYDVKQQKNNGKSVEEFNPFIDED